MGLRLLMEQLHLLVLLTEMPRSIHIPELGDPASNKWLTITSVTTNTFRVNVGTSSDTSSHTFVSAVTNGVTRRPVGISTVTITESLPYPVSIGMTVPIFEQSRILASSHSFEYIGSGTDISTALPQNGGVTIPANEVDSRNGGLVIYTSTDQDLVILRLVMVL